MTRRVLDKYYTPEHAVAELVKYVDWFDRGYQNLVFEPCVGEGAIVKGLHKYADEYLPMVTNDWDKYVKADAHMDASKSKVWDFLSTSKYGPPDYTISNPPFTYAPEIVYEALKHSQLGVAMLLRLSFLEGCYDRRWLVQRPPTDLIVLPRISFTGDGRGDSVTVAWFIWQQDDTGPKHIKIVSKFT